VERTVEHSCAVPLKSEALDGRRSMLKRVRNSPAYWPGMIDVTMSQRAGVRNSTEDGPSASAATLRRTAPLPLVTRSSGPPRPIELAALPLDTDPCIGMPAMLTEPERLVRSTVTQRRGQFPRCRILSRHPTLELVPTRARLDRCWIPPHDDGDPPLEQLAVDPRCSPRAGSSATSSESGRAASTALPQTNRTPRRCQPTTVSGLTIDESRSPRGPNARQPHPEPAVRRTQCQPPRSRSLQHLQLVRQGQHLQIARQPATWQSADGQQRRKQPGGHHRAA
jgi:hypothetical protein